MNTEMPIIEPKYVTEFQCWGERCPSNCCHSWDIGVDEKSFKTLKRSTAPAISSLASRYLKRDKKSAHYGKIKLLDNGNCPMLDKQGLCQIHSKLGHHALSTTCQSYPRVNKPFAQRVEQSLSLSCPAAASAVLFDPQAMQLKVASQTGPKQKVTPNTLPVWVAPIRDLCFDILLQEQIPLPQRLLAIGLLFKRMGNDVSDIAKVEQASKEIVSLIQSNKLEGAYESLPRLTEVKWQAFAVQLHHNLRRSQKSEKEQGFVAPADKRFNGLLDAAFSQLSLPAHAIDNYDAFSKTMENQQYVDAFEAMLSQSKEAHLTGYFEQHPQLLLNYLLYCLYHDQFLLHHQKTPFQYFKVLLTDMLVVEVLLSAKALEERKIDDDMVVEVFSAYSKRRLHSSTFVDTLEKYFNHTSRDSDAAIFALLT
ncbi:flagellin lysine-N-methylase [Ferrimonas aestuarii]|nr:flagellin lysine-N-methylase [Ferrimonas aestuarii]